MNKIHTCCSFPDDNHKSVCMLCFKQSLAGHKFFSLRNHKQNHAISYERFIWPCLLACCLAATSLEIRIGVHTRRTQTAK